MITHELNEAERTLRVAIPGDLLSTNFNQVNTALQAILDGETVKASGWTVLLLDLTAAKLIDSMGLNVLVGLVKRIGAPPRNGRIKTRISSPTIHRTLLFTRLEKYMEVEMVGRAV